MSRSKWKGPIFNYKLLKKKNSKKNCSRTGIIIPCFIGNIYSVYNGQKEVLIKITNSMLGFKLGDFIPTRKKYVYKKK